MMSRRSWRSSGPRRIAEAAVEKSLAAGLRERSAVWPPVEIPRVGGCQCPFRANLTPQSTDLETTVTRGLALGYIALAVKTLHELVADKLERDPSLLRIPLGNIDRWIAHGHTAPPRLEQWREIIRRAQASHDGFQTLLGLLRDRSDAAMHLKSFDPFPGVLTTLERRQVILECAYAH